MDLLATGARLAFMNKITNLGNTFHKEPRKEISMERSPIEKDISELVDIRDITIDTSLPVDERVKSYIQQIKDPYCFRVGDVKVRVSYSDTDRTLTDNFCDMLARMK